ncbi:MAG: dihydrolipoamide acetyltransferase family protein [Spirochaetota bacterium]
MPELSQTTGEVRFIRWLVEAGQQVKKGDPICEVETDKVTTEVESFRSGVVLKLYARPDTMVNAGSVIAMLGKPGETLEEGIQKKPTPKGTVEEVGKKIESKGAEEKTEATAEYETKPAGGEKKEKPAPREKETKAEEQGAPKKRWRVKDGIKATPLVRNIARRKNIDLNRVKGTGPQGLITKKDLIGYEKSSREARREAAGAEAESKGPQEPAAEVEAISLSTNQAAVAKNMVKSNSEAPHYYVKTQVFFDRVLQWREKNLASNGSKASMYSLFIYAVGRTLRQFPLLNAFFKHNRAVKFGGIHIGFAVAVGSELYVPVVKDADTKQIMEIDRDVRWLKAKALNHKLEYQDIKGGSFTVTNLGTYPVDEFCAIINPPQAGVLAAGQIKKTLYIDQQDAMHIRNACTVTGSFDHRIVNGAQAASFMARLKKILEEEI